MKNITILICEDEPMIREIMESFFSRRAGRVLVAVDGQQGLDLFESHQPDVVLTDLKMPAIDGIALARHIRSQGSTPVVMITAHSEKELMHEATLAGINDFLHKPIDLEEAERIVKRLIAG
ncbi:response regulator [Desulfurispira natronophila]|uniref:CheY-like chemotaxis protein n=1 Tax=Desulfurispira natronophila TaxID=682562 RepID=A0A7W7Y4B4_9BACT|nr:response regulator [Desulfurispira natronophila]MBB5021838.1 CheY-like chemotaxis protein [Desulfurispira natronophila]